MTPKSKLGLAIALIAAAGSAGTYAATFNDTWIDSTGKAVSARIGEGARSTAAGQTSGQVPSFSMDLVTVMSESTARAISDLQELFGKREELIATCSIPGSSALAVKLKNGAPETTFNRFSDNISQFQFRSFQYGGGNLKSKWWYKSGGSSDLGWTNHIINYAGGGSLRHDFQNVKSNAKTIKISLSKKSGYSVSVDGKAVASGIGQIDDLKGAVVKQSDRFIAENVLNMPVISYWFPRINQEYAEDQGNVYGTHVYKQNGSMDHVVYFDRYGANPYMNTSKLESAIAGSLRNGPTKEISSIPKYLFGYNGGQNKYAGEVYKSNGAVNIVDGFSIIGAEHIKTGGKYSQSIMLNVSPSVGVDRNGKVVSVLTSPFIVLSPSFYKVAVGQHVEARPNGEGASEQVYFKNQSGGLLKGAFSEISYPATVSAITVTCNLK